MDYSRGMVGGYADQTAIFVATEAGDFIIKMVNGLLFKDVEDWDFDDVLDVFEINIYVN